MNNVQLGIVLLPVHSVLASMAGARAPMGVHLPHLRDGISRMLRNFFFLVAKILCGICRGQFRNRFAILGLLLLVASLERPYLASFTLNWPGMAPPVRLLPSAGSLTSHDAPVLVTDNAEP